ncbi:penicillin-binding transpeptidase domain-containing protein [Opitutus sp. ER46]|uniref:peptidoglycan D,D-transpeptidase FtsI family protein n=1 Tax=Opitutus sp. ER46 TaxID=2161864 RepID=UPI000D327243|nr:penicillin-binding transpeptidase domain-containing protein [Opitutus sp. ER46]PTX97779.1 peptidoglycan glycosyltransferase [Opitutus sp. ER46]
MASSDVNLAEHSGSLLESHKGYNPRIVFFYFVVAALLLTLAGGLAYKQLLKADEYSNKERQQTLRRVVIPGPRGNIYDRNGNLLVGNRPVFSAVLHVDELRPRLLEQQRKIRANYRKLNDKDIPSARQIEFLARISLTQEYLDKVIAILKRDPEGPDAKIDPQKVQRHFRSSLLLPYTLLDNLSNEDYAKLLEALPVNGPVQVYSSSARYYPFNSLAAHTLGYVRANEDADDSDLPGEDLSTFAMKGAIGKDGLEKQFEDVLQGTSGGSIFRVDQAGFRINPPLAQLAPKRGKDLITSLDLDLQLTAEEAIGDDRTGAAVAIDVATGEVLALASKPDYDLAQFSPRATKAYVDEKITARNAWNNYAVIAALPPGSTFKILTSIAAMRRGGVSPDEPIVDCQAYLKVGNRLFPCYNGRERHGHILLPDAVAQSCDIFFYKAAELATADGVAAEARRFGLDDPTGIELPNETKRMLIPDAAWKKKRFDERWYPGDTANMAIGQGFVLETPLGMACFTASVARGEVLTHPTLLHDPNRPRQRTESIGLTRQQLVALHHGMEGCTITGTGKVITEMNLVPGIRVAGKTGTAQKDVVENGEYKGKMNVAWFICFAPVENPQIAVAVAIEGENLGEEYGGGRNSAPVAGMILRKYFEKKAAKPGPSLSPFHPQVVP